MGANSITCYNLTLAREKKKIGCRCRPTRGLGFHLAYDRLISNGLLFIWGALKKRKPLLGNRAKGCRRHLALTTQRQNAVHIIVQLLHSATGRCSHVGHLCTKWKEIAAGRIMRLEEKLEVVLSIEPNK
jgi:hypothetical protein